MTAADVFSRALVLADYPDEVITSMFRAHYSLDEIAERITYRSGERVSEGHVAAWLVEVGGFDECQAVYGRAACERPATPNSSPARCVDCDRSNR